MNNFIRIFFILIGLDETPHPLHSTGITLNLY